jgi:DNA-binding NarL/FixJ family response regulator
MTIRAFLVDDDELVRAGLERLLDAEHELEVVGQAASVQEAVSRIPQTSPNIAIVDGRLPDGTGVELCRDLRSRYPDIRFLILSAFDDEEVVLESVMAGADGYLVKGTEGSVIIEAIRKVAAGQPLLDPAAARSMMARLRADSRAAGIGRNLTAQERHVLDLLAEGLTNREIAERLHLAEKTVRNYVSNLLAKLGMKHRTEAALYAARRDYRGTST